jgi:hypothetical protein
LPLISLVALPASGSLSAGNEAVATLPKSDADAEEALLAEESKANQALLIAMFLLLLTTIGTSAF